jgi:hypothetical protein
MGFWLDAPPKSPSHFYLPTLYLPATNPLPPPLYKVVVKETAAKKYNGKL